MTCKQLIGVTGGQFLTVIMAVVLTAIVVAVVVSMLGASGTWVAIITGMCTAAVATSMFSSMGEKDEGAVAA